MDALDSRNGEQPLVIDVLAGCRLDVKNKAMGGAR